MTVKTTFRGGGEDGPEKYEHTYPGVDFSSGQARVTHTSSYWTKERNQAMDKEYHTDPRSPLHTNNRFPD